MQHRTKYVNGLYILGHTFKKKYIQIVSMSFKLSSEFSGLSHYNYNYVSNTFISNTDLFYFCGCRRGKNNNKVNQLP